MTVTRACEFAPFNLELKLPWPPSVNHYYRKDRKITVRGKAYRAEVQAIILNRYGALWIPGRLSVVVACTPPNDEPDLDNLGKALLDSMEHATVYRDDNQIDDLRYVRGPVCRPGHVIVRISRFSLADYEATFFDL